MRRVATLAAIITACVVQPAFAGARDDLAITTDVIGRSLAFDWPAIEIGIASYEAGPTGLTVFRFPERVSGVVDVRGGAPGTINTDLLRLGYNERTDLFSAVRQGHRMVRRSESGILDGTGGILRGQD